MLLQSKKFFIEKSCKGLIHNVIVQNFIKWCNIFQKANRSWRIKLFKGRKEIYKSSFLNHWFVPHCFDTFVISRPSIEPENFQVVKRVKVVEYFSSSDSYATRDAVNLRRMDLREEKEVYFSRHNLLFASSPIRK